MDDGYVIPGLDEGWTFWGAKLVEWGYGFVAAMIFSEVFLGGEKMGRYLPFILAVLFITTLGTASLRKLYPDEERGLRNHLLAILGLTPIDIPKPSFLQKIWSGAPVQDLNPRCKYMQLSLDKVFDKGDKYKEAERW